MCFLVSVIFTVALPQEASNSPTPTGYHSRAVSPGPTALCSSKFPSLHGCIYKLLINSKTWTTPVKHPAACRQDKTVFITSYKFLVVMVKCSIVKRSSPATSPHCARTRSWNDLDYLSKALTNLLKQLYQ